ncbi:GNAT family N-acetyltransferase [Kitasatospora sp. NBC_01560]|uniref:GNAT family N-acetyltransferase n=1 Tax=Kitasatospora sp. NBC_01560 TaxID=2975965 RepID=UPI00386A8272
MVRSWDAAVERAQERLTAVAGLRAVAAEDGRRFARWDLASRAEGELAERLDPEALDPAAERRLRERLGEPGREWPDGELYRRRYWLLDPGAPPGADGSSGQGGQGGPDGSSGHDGSGGPGGAPVGTLAVDNWTKGPGQLAVSSLYLRPSVRGRGLAAAALDEVYRAAAAEGLPGFCLEAHWSWRHAVRYYLRRGLWVVSWKRAIGLARMPQLPPYRVVEDGDRLVLLVAGRPDDWVPLLSAGREGGRLRLDETAAYRASDGWVHDFARSTLALHLALAGRPMVRGPQWWAEAWRWAELGEPEGLAYRIEQLRAEPGGTGPRPATIPAPAPTAAAPTAAAPTAAAPTAVAPTAGAAVGRPGERLGDSGDG